MTGDDARPGVEQRRPPDAIDRLCQQWGVMARQRTLTLGLLVRALVLSAGTPGGAEQADVLRSSLECAVRHVTRAALSRGFDAPLARFMEALAHRALADARAQPVELPALLRGVQDGSMVDSPTGTGRQALREECPGPGD